MYCWTAFFGATNRYVMACPVGSVVSVSDVLSVSADAEATPEAWPCPDPVRSSSGVGGWSPVVMDGSCWAVPHAVGVEPMVKLTVPPLAIIEWSIHAWSRATPLTDRPVT